MRTSRETELANEFFRLYDARSTSMADAPKRQSTAIYSDPEFLRMERARLFRGQPIIFCLSGEVAKPGDYVTADMDGLPVVVVRGKDGQLRALVNMCSHRGSRIFPDERGTVKGRGLSCPFHAWTFDTAGQLLSQPNSHDGFQQCDGLDRSLRHIDLFERHGVVFVTPVEAGTAVTPYAARETIFGAADEDIRDLNLQDCRFFTSSTRKLALNWKLVIDTFLEAYHVFALHKNTLANYQFATPNLVEDLGPVGLVIGVRKSILEEQDKNPADRVFSPHATLQYICYPNMIISHQIDHIETWRVFPGTTPDECVATTSIYHYGEAVDERTQRYLHRSLEVLMNVTDNEDFPQVIQTQRGLMAGGSGEFVFGRNEPGLVAYHNWLDRAMAGPGSTLSDMKKEKVA
ncbi:MAG: aromatic ring-hydroxylating dioxygenase subunit alpha [Sphingobium sp.]